MRASAISLSELARATGSYSALFRRRGDTSDRKLQEPARRATVRKMLEEKCSN